MSSMTLEEPATVSSNEDEVATNWETENDDEQQLETQDMGDAEKAEEIEKDDARTISQP